MTRLSIIEAANLAERFKTSVSTVRRISRSGLDPRDVFDVAKWILDKRQISPAIVEAVVHELQQIEDQSK